MADDTTSSGAPTSSVTGATLPGQLPSAPKQTTATATFGGTPKNAGYTPPKVVPATTTTEKQSGFVKADVFQSFRGLVNAFTYWMPTGLNEQVASARRLRQIVS